MKVVLYKLPVTKLIKVFENFVNTEIKGLVIHSFDVAKFASALARRLDFNPTKAYLLGFLHDFGLIVYSRLTSEEVSDIGDLTETGRLGFKIDSFVKKLDTGFTHSLISYAAVKAIDIFSEEEAFGVLYHHGIPESLEGSARTWAEIVMTSDLMSQAFRTNLSRGADEAYDAALNSLKNLEISNYVKEAASYTMQDLIDLVMIYDSQSHVEDFVDKQYELDFENILQFLKLMVMCVDLRSPYTRKHTINISELSYDLGMRILGTEPDAITLYAAGLIHDIGKIRTPLSILHKPGRLEKGEIMIMKSHVAETYRMFKDIDELSEIVQIAVLHHERLDGSGYPYGLDDSQIPLKARILQVADVFVALTEERPYRKGSSYDDALKIIGDLVKMGKLDKGVHETLSEMVSEGYKLNHKRGLIEGLFDAGDIETLYTETKERFNL